MVRLLTHALTIAGIVALLSQPAWAKDWFVAPGGMGDGTSAAPFGTVQAALLVAHPGDSIFVRPGTYRESIRTVRDGTADAPIVLRAASSDRPVLTTPGRVLQIDHSFIVVEGMIVDAAYGRRTAVSMNDRIASVVLRRVEVRRSGRDCVNIGAATDVLIEDSLIHHCLNAAGGRTDAHGIVAGAVRRLTIRGTEIHTFSGDAVQLNRTGTAIADGWDDVLIEGCHFWLAPLTQAENGFPAGAVTGENALDTKVSGTSRRARITIRDTRASGFGGGQIRVQAAFNLKEHIDAIMDRVTVRDSEVAFRVRGSSPDQEGAWVRIQNAVVHDVAVGIRYENDLQRLRVWNTTFGSGVERAFVNAASTRTEIDVRNLAFLGRVLPSEAPHPSNLAVDAAAFVDVTASDYRPSVSSPLVDAGTRIDEVSADRAGISRPQDNAYDVGAYEH